MNIVNIISTVLFQVEEVIMHLNYNEDNILTVQLRDDGVFPNNASLPVILYKQVMELPVLRPAAVMEKLFESNNWLHPWRGSIYDYHHYHSNTHELLGVVRGSSKILLGGEHGVILEIKSGDVLLIPAGVAHKNLEPEKNIRCIGAYAGAIDYDMNLGKSWERPQTDYNIHMVPMPEFDPVYGDRGPVITYWKKKKGRRVSTSSPGKTKRTQKN